MQVEYIFLISLYFNLFFYIGVVFKFLYEYPISPRCREIIDLEKFFPYLLNIYFESSTAVKNGF
jgi:hypothetical protein